MMNINFKKNENYAREMRELHAKVVEGEVKREQYSDIVKKLVKTQREDGSWSKLENYDIPSEARIDFLYNPTYLACAILLYLDYKYGLEAIDGANASLEKGLVFSTGRGLNGHGFDAINEQHINMRLFERAGVYVWFNKHLDTNNEFKVMWDDIIERLRVNLKEKRVMADWNRDFSKEMNERLDVYENYHNAEWLVLKTIRENENAISNLEISKRCGIELDGVICAVGKLLSTNYIKQDSRSVRAGHTCNDAAAYFYTKKDSREFIDNMYK